MQLPEVAGLQHDIVTGLSLIERTALQQRSVVVEPETDAAFGFGPDDPPDLPDAATMPPDLPEIRDDGGDDALDWLARFVPNPPTRLRQWYAQAAE